MPTRQKRQPTNLPTAIAYFAHSRLLREFLKPEASFIVCIVVEDDDLFEHHELAIHILMERRKVVRPNQIDPRYKVHAVFRKCGKTSRVLDDVYTERQVIYLLSESTEIPDELRLAADAIHIVNIPKLKDIRAAVRLLCGETPNREDAIFIGGAPWRASAACFRLDRSLDEALQRLQKFAVPGAFSPSSSVDEVGEDDGVEIPSLEDLVGYGAAKDWGLDFKADLDDLRMGQIGWDELDTGLLLSGPPGTGKTAFANVLAKSCGIPLFSASFAEWQRMGHLGDFFAAMRKTFGDAQDQAPSAILFDEIDSLGRRSGGFVDRDYMNAALNGFLECLDGSKRRRGVIVIATTNFPEQVDRALLRPGRIGRHIAIDLPGPDDRITILARYLGKAPSWIDQDVIVHLTEGMTGDDLKDVAKVAARKARRARTSLTMDHVISALPVRIQMSPARLRMNAVHESGHVIVALEYGRQIERVSIADTVVQSDRVQSGGAVTLRRKEAGFLSAADYLKEIAILLGGIAAEQEISGSHSDGAGGIETSDLTKATHLATLFVACFGMGRILAAEPILDSREAAQVRRLNPAIWHEVNEVLSRQLAQATDIIKRNRQRLDGVANALLAKRQLYGDDIARLLATNSAEVDTQVHHLRGRYL